MNTVDILGVKIAVAPTTEIRQRIHVHLSLERTETKIITTTYSEFIVAAQKDQGFKEILNRADLNVADGIGILWAATFLNHELRIANYGKSFRIIKILNLFLLTAWWTAFNQKKIKTVIPERIAGADLIWDICELATKNGSSVYLLGGQGDVASALKLKYPELKIAGRHEGNPDEQGLREKINASGADILLVAFGPIKQEYWIYQNAPNLRVKLAVGLGGTFDYLTGKRRRAGQIWQNYGLEWLHRLITQPWRIKRMWNAIVVFSYLILKSKFSADLNGQKR